MTRRSHYARRADLVHRAEDGKRTPLEIGSWAVYEPSGGLGLGFALQLVRITGGPTYDRDPNGHAVAEWWTCDVLGHVVSRGCLTRVLLAEHTAEACAAARHVRGLGYVAELDRITVATARAAELCRRYLSRLATLFRVDGSDLLLQAFDAASDARDVAHADDELRAAISWRRWFIYSALPSFSRNLYQASALTLAAAGARFETWPPWRNDEEKSRDVATGVAVS